MALEITDISGRVLTGTSVTITGTDFGTKTTVEPLLWDDFQAGTDDTALSDSPQIGTWSHISGETPTPTKYSTIYAHSGSQCAYTPAHHTGYANIRVNNLTTANKLYWSFWFRFNNGGATGHQTKLFQLWGNGPDECDYGPGVMSGGFSSDWFATYNIASGDDCDTGRIQEDYGFTPSQDTWQLAEMILERSSDYGVSDGTIIVKINNTTAYTHIGNILTRMSTSYGDQDWRSALFFYGFTNDDGLGSFAIDDVYFQDSWSRVELGNNAVYTNCTQRDIQRPTAWSNTSITISASEGGFSSNDTAYLFVIDEDNAPSAGYEVTVGATLPVVSTLQCEGETTPGAVADITPEFSTYVTKGTNNVSKIEIQVSATDNFAGDLVYDSGSLDLDPVLTASGRTDNKSYGE